jgi:hypothetical protein
MTMHQRTLIRRAVVDIIKAAATECGDRVFRSRTRGLWPEELPAILVYPENEPVSGVTDTAPREAKRDLALSIEIQVKGDTEETMENAGSTSDDLLDEICRQVETALAANDTLTTAADGQAAADCYLTGTRFAHSADGDEPILAAIMTWNVEYYTYMPEYVELDDFVTQHQDWDIATEETTGEPAADGEVDADNTNELPQ